MLARTLFVVATLIAGNLLSTTFAQEATKTKKKSDKNAQAAKKEAGAKRQALRVVPAAKAFLKTLSADEKAKAVIDFDSEKRVQWHFIPKETRKGLPVMEMSQDQKEAAMKLLRATVSQVGYDQSRIIMKLESVLLKLEGPASEGRRNPEKYYFTLFGEVGQKSKWGISIEGHHLSLNFTLQGNKIIDSTPQFFAANPAELKDDFGDGLPKGLRVLKAEEQLGFKLIKSLNEEQTAKATLEGETPDEIRGAGSAQPPTESLGGLSVAEMSDEQKATLKKLMQAYTRKMKPLVAKERWELIEQAGFDKIEFTWSGPTRPGIGHYYVVQGPTFVIEFINVQPDAAGNPANHIHCVWRDMSGDFDLPISE